MGQTWNATRVIFTVCALAFTAEGQFMIKDTETISGAGLLAIQAAVPEANKRNLKLGDYTVSVIETDSAILVVFQDPKAGTDQRGSTDGLVGLEVELSKGLKVKRANLVR